MQEAPLFDAAQLERRVMGDEALRIEVLSLFIAEAERLLAQVEEAPDDLVRASRLQAMANLARNVGAARLADLCRVMQARAERGEAGWDAELDRLRAAVDQVLDHLRTRAL
jgi:HPt (histidine-containing phosphotransfer) domain-containing protein